MQATLVSNCTIVLAILFGLSTSSQSRSEDITSLRSEIESVTAADANGHIKTLIQQANGIIQTGDLQEKNEAQALRGILRFMSGDSQGAFEDLQSAYSQNGNLRLRIPVKTTNVSTSTVNDFASTHPRDVGIAEIFYELCVETSADKPARIAFAFAVANMTANANPKIASKEQLECYKRDIAISSVLMSSKFPPDDPESISSLFKCVCGYDDKSGLLTVNDSKWTSFALLQVATYLTNHKTGHLKGFPRLSAIQFALLSASLPSTTESSYVRSMTFIADQYERANYPGVAEYIRDCLADKSHFFSTDVSKLCNAALSGDPAIWNTAINAFRLSTPLPLIREHTNPIFLDWVTIDSPLPSVNILSTLAAKSRFGVSTDVIAVLQMHLLNSFVLWNSPTSTPSEQRRGFKIACNLVAAIGTGDKSPGVPTDQFRSLYSPLVEMKEQDGQKWRNDFVAGRILNLWALDRKLRCDVSDLLEEFFGTPDFDPGTKSNHGFRVLA